MNRRSWFKRVLGFVGFCALPPVAMSEVKYPRIIKDDLPRYCPYGIPLYCEDGVFNDLCLVAANTSISIPRENLNIQVWLTNTIRYLPKHARGGEKRFVASPAVYDEITKWLETPYRVCK